MAERVIAAGGVEGVALDVNGPQGTLTPEEFGTHARGLQDQLQARADQHLQAQGIEPAEFYAFLHRKGPSAVNAAALTMLHSQNAALALGPMLAEFRRTSRGRR